MGVRWKDRRVAAHLVTTSPSQTSPRLQLPDRRTPNQKDRGLIASGWRPLLDERIHSLELWRDRLASCIGCGCLSLDTCALQNPGDQAAEHGVGPRYLLGDLPVADPA